MRKLRKYNHSSLSAGNLDSFLDIMTNTVGVLMFVSLFITLVAVQSGTTIRTPLVSQTEKSPHLFEVVDNHVSYLDTEEISRQIKDFVKTLPTCTEPIEPYSYGLDQLTVYIEELRQYKSCLDEKVSRFREFRPQTESYQVQLVDIESFSWQYQKLNKNIGTSNEQLSEADSQFKEIISRLDPEKDYIAFIVKPDSFSTYRKAREIAWKKGFNVGWEPQKLEQFIILGSSGRSIGIQ
ncbi:hypothetical protein GSN00_05735 [Cylindrospermopsis raciborskii CHAB3438]|uniref:hypothetical protein n=2 Tax=Cylindrospermopsis raciborskii TaxID=77022 RepID=UPI001F0F7B6C|nr:hypothetical protein [Cylindrospermopsis raciborskii]MCH4903895.1 hypothetical protein [Cylindrospermopsis raciborskii CHAB3438]